MEISISITLPEFDGALHSVPIAAKSRDIDGNLQYTPIFERINRLVSKAKKWTVLRRKPNSEKKIAIVFHNFPAKNSNIGSAVGLDTPESIRLVLASMDNVAIRSLTYEELTVTAIVTGGIETNGGRVGDPSDYYKPLEKPYKLGTINIILLLDSDMPAGTLTRALVTCTEAKTAAIQELMAGSNYSTGIATGSGTDQTIIVANTTSELYLEGSGKHSKMGELIGKVVMGTMINEANIRGVDNGTLVMVNGNPVSWRGKYNLDAIPADSIERIEIVKGGGSVLYGSEAMFILQLLCF